MDYKELVEKALAQPERLQNPYVLGVIESLASMPGWDFQQRSEAVMEFIQEWKGRGIDAEAI